MVEAIQRAVDFSEQRLAELRKSISDIVPPEQLVITVGSYARREASASSDLDYYTILQDDVDASVASSWDDPLRQHISDVVGTLPSAQGAFAANVKQSELLNNYGGSRDSNETITRRMLYLLEGEHLTCQDKFLFLRNKIIRRYVANTPRDHQLAFYLLNDVIRYWRTLAVDYADKTFGTSNPKPWPVRNIKLIFSRKLIYASGLFSVALTADRSEAEKISILEAMFNKTPLERIKYVSGDNCSRRLLEMYSFFLEEIGDPEKRHHLDSLTVENATCDPVFRKLKNEGHYFSRELMGTFTKTFHSSHPIHMAVIF